MRWNNSCASMVAFAAALASPDNSINSFPNQVKIRLRMIRASDDGAILYQRRLRINVRQRKSPSNLGSDVQGLPQPRLATSIKHEQEI
jgi:hypothetical protein